MSDLCPMCGEPLYPGKRGPKPRYCSARCRMRASRARAKPDWTGGAAPVRLDTLHVPRPRVDDLEAQAFIGQLSVFTTAKEHLATRLPAERAWRWQEWLAHEEAFRDLFGDVT